MKKTLLRSVLSTLLLFPFFVQAEAGAVELTDDEIGHEHSWLASLGLVVPSEGILLRGPFAKPFSRRSFIVPTEWYRSYQRPRMIDAALFARDLPLLRASMEKVYAGWEPAAKRGWNWSGFFDRWQADVASRGPGLIPVSEAFKLYAEFAEFQRDNHTGPQLNGLSFQSGSRSAIIVSSETLRLGPGAIVCDRMRNSLGQEFQIQTDDSAQQPRTAFEYAADVAKLRPVSYLSYPAERGAIDAVRCGDWHAARAFDATGVTDRLGQIQALAEADPEEPAFKRLTDAIGYLRLPTFTFEVSQKLERYREWLPTDAHDVKTLIVDLRANDGGSGEAAIQLLGEFLNISDVQGAIEPSVEFKRSCLTPPFAWGLNQVFMQSLAPPLSDGLRRQLQAQLESLAVSDPVCEVSFEEHRSSWGYSQHVFPTRPSAGKPKILVLVDNLCGSDCEYIAQIIAAAPGSVMIGANTYGVAQYIQPGYTILPNSRVMFRMARGLSDIYGDGRSLDGYGLDVDIVIPNFELHEPSAILRLAEALMKF